MLLEENPLEKKFLKGFTVKYFWLCLVVKVQFRIEYLVLIGEEKGNWLMLTRS